MKSTILKKTNKPILQQKIRKPEGVIEKEDNPDFARLTSAQVMSYASKVWGPQQSVSTLITAETVQIIHFVKNRKHVFFSGKSEKGILSGIFYLLAMKNRIPITQRQIARRLSTTDVTVRASYRDWIENFPEFFPVKTHHTRRVSPST